MYQQSVLTLEELLSVGVKDKEDYHGIYPAYVVLDVREGELSIFVVVWKDKDTLLQLEVPNLNREQLEKLLVILRRITPEDMDKRLKEAMANLTQKESL